MFEFLYGFSVEIWYKYCIVWSDMSGLILYIDGMNVNFKIFVLNVLVIL